ncbi:MAG: glycoside hydrolase family 9 protein [Salinivirgaceae bacterium]
MKQNLILLGIMVLAISCSVQSNKTGSGKVFLNSLGFTPNGSKIATVLGDSGEFKIIDASTNKEVFEAETGKGNLQTDVNETAFIADFSAFNKPGNYYLETSNGTKSVAFKIDSNAYDSAFYTTMRGFYLWRCGTTVDGTHKGDTFHQEACHLEDGWLNYTEFGNKQKDGTGGWHDAGDFGKYVVNAGVTMGQLFMTWDNFQPKLEAFKLDIPNTAAAYPDYLKELKYETDWLLKMQYADNSGRVSHKLTRLNFEPFVMANQDLEKRYFTEWGSSATACFTAIMAQAARYFLPYDTAYAETCFVAAKKSYDYLYKHPEFKKWDQKEFHTGGYQCGDKDFRIWAAAEMWETTGQPIYLADFENKMSEETTLVDLNWDWGNVKNLGVFTYLLSEKEGKTTKVNYRIIQDVIEVADSIVNFTSSDVYGRPFDKYYWGCNGTVARLSANLYLAYILTGDEKYKRAGEQIIAHLFGRNFYGRSFVTGLGIKPAMNPHDRRSGGDSVVAPWPGYLVGGGHTATDWVDKQKSYSHNEIAINWQAALVYSLAWVME